MGESSLKATLSRLEAQLTMDEGWKSKPYRCTAGALTIGVGHNLDASGLCDEAILAQLKHDIAQARAAAKRVMKDTFEQLDTIRQDAIVMWVFQLGEAGFQKFSPTISLIEQKKYAAAADRIMISKWAKQTPKRARLIAKMIEHGEY